MEGRQKMALCGPGSLIALVVLLLTVLPAAVQAAGTGSRVLDQPAKSADVQVRTLGNGLQVLVLEDHAAPLVSTFIWYRVGLRNEGPHEAGLSHFLEHMLFRGTEKYTGQEMERLLTQRGGYYNGFTWMDFTAYVETLPIGGSPPGLDLALDIESQRMAHARLTAEDVQAEKGPVLSEFEGDENDPTFALRTAMLGKQFPGQPYGREVIGDKNDIQNLTRDQVLDYYHRNYVPNNASLVIVGDVNAADAFAKAEQYFGSIPPGHTPAVTRNTGREADGERRVRLELPGRTSYVSAMYQVPPIQDADHVPLEVLQNVLMGGRTSRLYRALVDTQIASQATGVDYEDPDPTLFEFTIAVRPGVDNEKAEQAVDAVIEQLKSQPVDARELTKAKNQTKANFVYAGDGASKLAEQIGEYQTIYTYRYLRDFPAKVDAVTPDDIRRVVGKYFDKDRRTVGWLIATGGEGPPAGISRPGPATYRPRTAPRLPAAAEGAGAPAPATGQLPAMHDLRLPNGMRVVLQENHSAPFVVAYGYVTAGPIFDPTGKAGVAAFTAQMASRGTQKRSWQQIQGELEFAAAQLGFGVRQQVATVVGQCLTHDLPLLLNDAAEQLMLPSFPPDEVEKVRTEIYAAQHRRDEDPAQVARKELFARLYPVGHPLHEPLLGSHDSVARITRDDLLAFHAQYYRPENTLLAIVGDFDPAQAEALVKAAFGGWARQGEPARPTFPQVPLPAKAEKISVPIPNKTQDGVVIGFPGISRRDPDYYNADLMNYVLSGGGSGLVSRLYLRIREQMSAAYYVDSSFVALWGPGPWMLQMGVDPAKVNAATTAAFEEIRKIQQAPPTEEELNLWKGFVAGTVALEMETFAGTGLSLVTAAFYDLGLDFPYRYPKILAAITADQAWQAAKQELHPDNAITVVAGPAEAPPAPAGAPPPAK